MSSNQKIDILKGYLKGRYRVFVKLLLNRSHLARKVFINKDYAASKGTYCYDVWMNHLKHWLAFHKTVPNVVMEIGSGNSLGVGLAALLSGASKFYALEKTQFWNNSTNLRVFDELVDMFKQRQESKSFYEDAEGGYTEGFPHQVLNNEYFKKCLSEDRLFKIRKELEHPQASDNIFIRSIIPWTGKAHIANDSVDLICSHTVLQHVMDLDFTYIKMGNWLKPGGYMSHTIDFKCMNTSKLWNGHWTYNKSTWKIVTGGANLINREPLSTHLQLLNANNFNIKFQQLTKKKNKLLKHDLAKRFKSLKEKDLTTSGVYFFAEKSKVLARS